MGDSVLKNRSYRRFHQEVDITPEAVRELVDLARISASAGNARLPKYINSHELQRKCLMFPHPEWARYLKFGQVPLKGKDHQPALSV